MLILASNSPRRKELLTQLGYGFVVCPSDCDETTDITDPVLLVKELSYRKAMATNHSPYDTIIGSDTVVAVDNEILGKPKNKDDAKNMLKKLSNKSHYVHTGVTFIQGDTVITECVSCMVVFKELSNEEIERYTATDEPMDKAGAYAIQGKASAFVKEIHGDYFAVVGFPCCFVNSTLNKLNIYPER